MVNNDSLVADVLGLGKKAGKTTICLTVKCVKLTGKILAMAMRAALGSDAPGSVDCKIKGKQTVSQLTRQGQGVSSIEINESGVKSFDKIAKKHGIDYAIKADTTEKPPKYHVFFKANSADVLTAAFKEYSAKELGKKAEKPSLLGTLGYGKRYKTIYRPQAGEQHHFNADRAVDNGKPPKKPGTREK